MEKQGLQYILKKLINFKDVTHDYVENISFLCLI